MARRNTPHTPSNTKNITQKQIHSRLKWAHLAFCLRYDIASHFRNVLLHKDTWTHTRYYACHHSKVLKKILKKLLFIDTITVSAFFLLRRWAGCIFSCGIPPLARGRLRRCTRHGPSGHLSPVFDCIVCFLLRAPSGCCVWGNTGTFQMMGRGAKSRRGTRVGLFQRPLCARSSRGLSFVRCIGLRAG